MRPVFLENLEEALGTKRHAILNFNTIGSFLLARKTFRPSFNGTISGTIFCHPEVIGWQSMPQPMGCGS